MEKFKKPVSSELKEVLLNPPIRETSKNGEQITIPHVTAETPSPPNKAEDGKNTPLRLSSLARKRMTKIVAGGMPFAQKIPLNELKAR